MHIRNLVVEAMDRESENILTGVVFHTNTFDPIRHIRQARQARDEPAVSKVSLLNVPGEHIFHESRLFEDLVDTLDGLGDVCRGIC